MRGLGRVQGKEALMRPFRFQGRACMVLAVISELRSVLMKALGRCPKARSKILRLGAPCVLHPTVIVPSRALLGGFR